MTNIIARPGRAARTFSLLLILCGCAPGIPLTDLNQVSPSLMKQAVNMKVYTASQTRPQDFEFKAMVEGHSCKHLLTDTPPSFADAIMRMKVDAANKGTNAILDYACEPYGTDTWGTDCWASISCRGTGVVIH